MIYNETLNVSLSNYQCGSCTLYIGLIVVIFSNSCNNWHFFIYYHWYLKKYPKVLLPV